MFHPYVWVYMYQRKPLGDNSDITDHPCSGRKLSPSIARHVSHRNMVVVTGDHADANKNYAYFQLAMEEI